MKRWIVTVAGVRVGSVRAPNELLAHGRAATLFAADYCGTLVLTEE